MWRAKRLRVHVTYAFDVDASTESLEHLIAALLEGPGEVIRRELAVTDDVRLEALKVKRCAVRP